MDYDIVIIGAGFAGIGMAIHLKKLGKHSFIVLERGDQIGGTWRDNHYPGAACDVPSHLYSYSFEPNPNWTYAFSKQEEILAYNQHCIDKYELAPYVKTNKTVDSAKYNEDSGSWTINTSDGASIETKIVFGATGPLNKASYPKIDGIDSFAGPAFHTSHWDKSVSLKGKRVGVIGTGASAIQVVPAIVDEVKELHLFQRTAAWVIPRPDRKISRFEQKMFTALPFTQRFMRKFIYWRNEFSAIGFVKYPKMMNWVQKLGEFNIRKGIKDLALREKVTPNYTIGCKRILLSNDYYPALANQKTTVQVEGISTITENGIQLKNGVNIDVDVLIYATGFEASEQMAPFPIAGRNNLELKELWKHGGESYKGAIVHGFPNFFSIIGPNTGLGHSSMIIMMEAQYQYFLKALDHVMQPKTKSIEVKKAVQDKYNSAIQTKLKNTIWAKGGCKSWYQNRAGKNTTLWPGFTFTYHKQMANFSPENYTIRNN